MEGWPEQALAGAFRKMMHIVNKKTFSEKKKRQKLKRLLNKAEASEPHTSLNEAKLILDISSLGLMKKKKMFNDHKKIVCSYTKPNEMDYLDCERPVSATACGGSWDQYGPEFMFAHAFVKADSPLQFKPFGITKVAVGGTQIYARWMKDNRNEPDNYWNTLVDAIKGAKGSLEAFVWLQGENDSFDDWNKENYLYNLTKFVSDVRNVIFNAAPSGKFSSASKIPVIIVELGYWIQYVDMAVIEAQRTYVASDPNAPKLVKSGAGSQAENLTAFYHYDAASQLIIGSRIAWAMAELLNSS